MDTGNNTGEESGERPIFSAVITPHRSLGRTGFIVLMTVFGAASFVSGVIFARIGAWPIFGFFGLDVVLVFLAFRTNYRRANAYERVVVRYEEIEVVRVDHRGNRQEWRINPLWAQIESESVEEFGMTRLMLVARGSRLNVAIHLGPEEKASFATALTAAVNEAKRGPTRNVFAS
ncbi:hypothetical protein GJW-30_1_04313 [Variibacter gotjawalensis]|uniref:DUF2244 domain-containing protein n=1 Tax=Variibacter gotjawalensis TaxID=1333996 RepID=A0A0S3Q0Q4_9BRAD|nr:DUF2244 domain-containing protein [Variibacter gotjawalensis]NIK47592.1 putative membrane protein [Variibacter gotjawalensis]RZS49489.1 putative membrane protein [Variibacter gotjawalensis]BAT61752.1 hypothetical protein GJW-30_1_04313 [Variibacter gotjawalensis]